MSRRFTVQFITRDECALCDAARPLVKRAVKRMGGSIEEVDVDGAPDLVRTYGERVPVVVGPDGSVLAEGRIDKIFLARRLRNLKI